MTRALILALIAALLGLGLQTGRLHLLQVQTAREAQHRAEATAESQRVGRLAQARIDDETRKATDAYITRAAQANRTAAGLDADRRGLLDAISAAGGTTNDPAAACRADAERVRVLERLLAEGAGLASEGGSRVASLAAKVSGLQDHARAVGTSASGAIGQVPLKD